MQIARQAYIEKLKNRLHNGMIKVVTGVRRSGKSYLIFELFKEYLLKNHTDKKHIIMIELERLQEVPATGTCIGVYQILYGR
ncbi:MAG: AAA family ATPase [Treponema sp.]